MQGQIHGILRHPIGLMRDHRNRHWPSHRHPSDSRISPAIALFNRTILRSSCNLCRLCSAIHYLTITLDRLLHANDFRCPPLPTSRRSGACSTW
jgi:hypothetical protein